MQRININRTNREKNIQKRIQFETPANHSPFFKRNQAEKDVDFLISKEKYAKFKFIPQRRKVRRLGSNC